jgi:anaerobic selenocysteine-containing dehydrogenase
LRRESATADGDLAEVSTPRGPVRAGVRVGGIREGVLFLPFHYGYWPRDQPRNSRDQARNSRVPARIT